MITKVMILAGGRGKRLSPLTDTLPKPLLPINNVPALSHILRSLEKTGIRRATLTVGYQKEKIMQRYGGIFRTLRLDFATEDKPLGTAGAVKAACYPAGPATDAYGDPLSEDGDLLVLSGDALFEGDLSELIEAHERSRADVTIAAKEVEDVSGYGVIVGKTSRIEAFVEKPDPRYAPSHLVNMGIYLLSQRVLAEIPRGAYDFGRELFPSLLQKGYTLAYHPFDAYWCDIGTHESYLDANLRKNDGKSVIGNHCNIADSAHTEQSVLMDSVTLGERSSVISSVLSPNVTLADGVSLFGCVVGEGCHLTNTPPDGSLIRLVNGTLSYEVLPHPLRRKAVLHAGK